MSMFLTSQEMQDLISVDRSTVYRMAEDGRLPGVKVGRQWRFPADRVAAQLGMTDTVIDPTPSPPPTPAPEHHEGTGLAALLAPEHHEGTGLAALLAPTDAQQIADLIGDLFGVMAVITDMQGNLITEVANPCGYFDAIADQPEAVSACAEQWRSFAGEPHVAPRWVKTHLGFLCARTFVWVDLKPVGMIVVGGVTPTVWPPDPDLVESIAGQVGVPSPLLFDHVDETWHLGAGEQRRVLQLLPQMGDLVSQLVTAHSRLAQCLDAGAAAPNTNSHVPPERVRS